MLELQRSVPIWSVIPIVVLLLAVTSEIGYRLGRRARNKPTHDPESLAADLTTPAIGLLGLMLAFTFGWAATRFDSRLSVRLNESQHLANAFHLANFLPQPDRDRTQSLLRDYIAVSLEAQGVAGFQASFTKREAMHHELWSIAVRAGQANPNSQIAANFIKEMGEILNSHLSRSILAVSTRIPVGMVIGLIAILSLTMGMIGYQMGLRSPVRSPALIPLILSIAIVSFLIIDLDRPLEGALQIHDPAFRELQRELQTWK